MPISIILHNPLYSGNLGSVARAMKNTGLKELILVNPVANRNDKAAQDMAVGAKNILAAAKMSNSLADTIKKFNFVYGTSRRQRRSSINWLGPKEFLQHRQQFSKTAKIALLFGNEESGLANEELDHCGAVIHIPTSPDYPSLNLAAAVQILSYECFMATPQVQYKKKQRLEVAAVEAMLQDMETTLEQIQFFRKRDSKTMMRPLRAFFYRSELSAQEIKIFRGVFRKMRWLQGKIKT